MITKNNNLSIFYFLGGWLIYVFLYTALKLSESTWTGILAFSSSFISILIALWFAFWLWRHSEGKSRLFFGFLTISTIGTMLDVLLYKITYNVLHIPHGSAPLALSIADNVAYLTGVIFQLLALGSIFPRVKLYQKKLANIFTYAPIVVVVSALSIMFFLSNQLNFQMNLDGIEDFVELFLQLAGFVVVILCLAIAKNKGVFYLSLAYIMKLVTDLIISTGMFSQAYGIGGVVETGWFLSSLLGIYGLYYFKRSETFKENSLEWVHVQDSIKSQTIFWNLAVCFLSLAASVAIGYLLLPKSIFF